LASLVAGGGDVSACLREVARTIARCHANGPADPRIAAVATREELTALWQTNLRELNDFVPSVFERDALDEIGRLAESYLDGREKLLNERIARGLIVDGHGDLLVDDIFCLDDGPRILDCLEFDDRLRWGDVLCDVGFLAMDLERLGRSDLARAFLDWYAEYSAEAHPRSLEHHYVAYRALVRAKVSCLKGGPSSRVEALEYLAQCQRHLRTGRVRVVVVGGLPGTGKTTVARGVGRSRGWAVLSSDELRKQEAGLDALQRATAEYGAGLYTPAGVEGTYERMLTRARVLLNHGESVVLDASFAQPRWRAAARAMAEDTRADIVELHCELPTDIAADRLCQRALRHADASDADPAVALAMAGSFAPWPSAIDVDTRPPPEATLQHVLDAVDAAT
jgi:predicted kinase